MNSAAKNEDIIEGELALSPKDEVIDRPATRSISATPTPADLLGMAVSQGADLDRLERLMELQERWEANEARKAFTVAMTAFKAEPVEILKRKNVSFTTRDGDTTSYNHAELSDVTAAIGAALAKHQLAYRWNIRQEGTSISVDCIITHARGHSEMVTMFAAPDDSGKKNKIQQVASTTTYLQRYTLLAITGMSTKGMDDDGRGSEPVAGNDQKAMDWISAAEGISAMDEYAKNKAELIASYGDVTKVPPTVIGAFNVKYAELKKAATA